MGNGNTTTSWLDTLSEVLGTRRVRVAAAEIAQASCHSLWEQVERRVRTMPLAEARGYVRAKSRPLIRSQVDRSLRLDRGLGEWARTNLSRQATDEVVELVVNVLRLQQRIPVPVPARRAA